jgi:hypothetical protein
MGSRVEYLCDPDDPASVCWSFTPLEQNLEGALAQARAAGADVKSYFGAKSFRIVDTKGAILVAELIR